MPNTPSRRILTQVLYPRRHLFERVAHCISVGTRVGRYERVGLRAYQLARNAVGGKGGHARMTVACTLPAHRVEHGTHDLHHPALCRRARLVWLRLLPDEAKAIVVEFPQDLSVIRPML